MGTRVEFVRQWTVNCFECDHHEVVSESRSEAEKRREWHDHHRDVIEVIPWKRYAGES
jgi:hypothetical protein